MERELIKKYLNNKCTEEEVGLIVEWLLKSSGTPEGKTLLYDIWDKLPDNGEVLTVDFESLLNNIHHRINLKKSKMLLDKSNQNIIRYNRHQTIFRILRNTAAILLIPVLGFGLYFSSEYYSARQTQAVANQSFTEVFSSVDAITKVTLPDGSNVWLNHRSTLRYPAVFIGDTRLVELKGEGYFEVRSDSKMPFIVQAGEIQVVARGTEFNILAYEDEDKIETSLISGILDINRLEENGKPVPLLTMKPTDLTVYDVAADKAITRTIKDDRYYSWKDGKLVFNKEPMAEVVRKLNRWFNADIQIEDPEILDLTLTATFVHESLPQVMELLTRVAPVSYTVSNREEEEDGTFTKRRIILSYGREQVRKIYN